MKRIKKILYNFSIYFRIKTLLFLISVLMIYFLIRLSFIYQVRLSSIYYIIFEEFTKYLIFFIYQILVIFGTKIDFNSLELNRIERLIYLSSDKNKKLKFKYINYNNLPAIRTFIFYSPLYFSFVFFPIIISSTFPFFDVLHQIYEVLKFKSINVIRANLIILIGINFLSSFNTIIINLNSNSRKNYFSFFSFIIASIYRLFVLYLTGISMFSAIYNLIFIGNLLLFLILFYLSFQKNIWSNIYVE